jgi:hypothetical protein
MHMRAETDDARQFLQRLAGAAQSSDAAFFATLNQKHWGDIDRVEHDGDNLRVDISVSRCAPPMTDFAIYAAANPHINLRTTTHEIMYAMEFFTHAVDGIATMHQFIYESAGKVDHYRDTITEGSVDPAYKYTRNEAEVCSFTPSEAVARAAALDPVFGDATREMLTAWARVIERPAE